MKRLCPICKKRSIQKHHNSKYCLKCALEKRKHPTSNLSDWQKKRVELLVGKLGRKEIGKKLKLSESSLQRFAREEGFRYYIPKYKKELIDSVIDCYVKFGKIKTQKMFPNVKVRSIVDRYVHEPRQRPWTNEQLIELVKMAGLVSMKSQARWFNRPNAHRGSIESAWIKKFNCRSFNINGLTWSIARYFVEPRCFVVKTEFWSQKKGNIQINGSIVLWVDLEKYLLKNIPEHIQSGIKALAKFQRWLHGKTPEEKIVRLIKEREWKAG